MNARTRTASPPEVVVALDVPGADAARRLLERLPAGTWCKIGLELFVRAGPRLVDEVAAAGHPIFLDLKLHDIPNTVRGAVAAAADLGVRLLTVHAVGGEAMLAAAAASAAATAGRERPRILAVTVLTSLDRAALERTGAAAGSVQEQVQRLARLAAEGGADGVVASVAECRALKRARGADFLVVTPGIRLTGDAADDQKRIATPAEASAAGSDFLVVGRSITRAADPAEALARVRAEAHRRP